MTDVNEHFLSHPELRPYFDEIVPLLISESDRGAVLLRVSKIDQYLKDFFEKLVPESVSGKRRKDIFNYSGVFGTLSSKLDIALVCRLLSPEIVKAAHKLRKIRNDLAHQTSAFNLNAVARGSGTRQHAPAISVRVRPVDLENHWRAHQTTVRCGVVDQHPEPRDETVGVQHTEAAVPSVAARRPIGAAVGTRDLSRDSQRGQARGCHDLLRGRIRGAVGLPHGSHLGAQG